MEYKEWCVLLWVIIMEKGEVKINQYTYFCNYVLELSFLPCICRMVHHCNYCIVVLFIFVVKEDQLTPEVRLLCSPKHLKKGKTKVIRRHLQLTSANSGSSCYALWYFQYLWNIDSGPEEFQMFSHLLWFVFRVQNGKFREHSHVSTLQAQSCFQEGNQLFKVTTVLGFKAKAHS